jgi:hypothetical protein
MERRVEMTDSNIIESVVIQGDLSKLTPEQRVTYYQRVCTSLGLNPLTRPFNYIVLNGKLTLYANKDASEQLRKNNGVSIEKPDIRFEDDWIIVTVTAHDGNGRTDSDIGVVNKKDMQNNFGNALMKAVTKAKRRVTLSICGLGMLDETEIETIPGAQMTEQPALPAQAETEKPNGNGKPVDQIENIYQATVDAGLFENIHEAKNALAKCNTGYDTPEKAIAWSKLYRGWREMGAEPKQAAEYANNGETSK